MNRTQECFGDWLYYYVIKDSVCVLFLWVLGSVCGVSNITIQDSSDFTVRTLQTFSLLSSVPETPLTHILLSFLLSVLRNETRVREQQGSRLWTKSSLQTDQHTLTHSLFYLRTPPVQISESQWWKAEGEKKQLNLHSSMTPVCTGSVGGWLGSAHTPQKQRKAAAINQIKTHTHTPVLPSLWGLFPLQLWHQAGGVFSVCLHVSVSNCCHFYLAKTVFWDWQRFLCVCA